MSFDEQQEVLRLSHVRHLNVYKLRKESELQEEREDREKKRRNLQEEVYRVKETAIKQREQQVLKEMSSKMENYLQHNLVCFLMEGLDEIV